MTVEELRPVLERYISFGEFLAKLTARTDVDDKVVAFAKQILLQPEILELIAWAITKFSADKKEIDLVVGMELFRSGHFNS